jgi:uncharacterized protein YodC (DUF2158 family)
MISSDEDYLCHWFLKKSSIAASGTLSRRNEFRQEGVPAGAFRSRAVKKRRDTTIDCRAAGKTRMISSDEDYLCHWFPKKSFYYHPKHIKNRPISHKIPPFQKNNPSLTPLSKTNILPN